MKKILILIIVIVMIAFVSCGPSAKDKAEKAKQDSIAKNDSIPKYDTIALKKILIDSSWTTATFSEWGYYFKFNNNNTIKVKYEPCCPPMGLETPESKSIEDEYNAKIKNYIGHYAIKERHIEIYLNGEKAEYVYAKDIYSISQVDTSFISYIKMSKFPMLIPLNRKRVDNDKSSDFTNYILVSHF